MTALMLQGTGSDVGKSLLVAGLCRAARNRGLRVAPFKPQNMSNNAAATPDGGEIGRAQALQAMAAGLSPNVHMNPVLLKPEGEMGSQVVVQGQVFGTYRARDYQALKPMLLAKVLESYQRLRSEFDLVIVEGAGSPAEINLRPNDIANMGFARAADVPVVLVGDIDRGGVIAQIVGTRAVLDDDDAAHVAGFIINKFRGDQALFKDGYDLIQSRSGWQGFGVAPWFKGAGNLPAEDSQGIASQTGGHFKIVVPVCPHIANFDDLDPLASEPDVSVIMVKVGQPLPPYANLVVLVGSKHTAADLAALRAQHWDDDIRYLLRQRVPVLGICGGYQMLGYEISDPDGLEGTSATIAGLGLLDVSTVMRGRKQVRPVVASHVQSGLPVQGYEIHIGQTEGPDCDRPVLTIDGRPDGAISDDGLVQGTYVHGLFQNDAFRRHFLGQLGVVSRSAYGAGVDQTLDQLAAHLEHHLDVDGLLNLAR